MSVPPSGAGTETSPEAAPTVPGAPVVKQTERPHPLTPFIRGWLVFVAIVFAFGRELIPDGDSGGGVAALGFRFIALIVLGVVLLAAAAGYVSWRFTRFVIDSEELRVETGVLFKSSRKIAFERLQSVDVIQPLAARIFGLAELRLEAGAGDSTIRLRYLGRAKASRLRDYLLVRAHGGQANAPQADDGPVASAFTDAGADEHPLVIISPQRLVLSFLLSTEWLISVLVLVVILVVTTFFDVTILALGGLIPLLLGTVSLVGRRVVAMFHFTLAESSRGLRITRGLTNLTSQSVPVDRIQGVKLSQSVLWRRPGWWRVDVDIVGYGHASDENNSSGATSVLLPVADAGQVAVALSRVLPGFAVDQVPLQPAPRRARWVRWFDFWTLRSGWDERAIVTQHGWLVRERHLVPHAKTQSVRIEQGPLQRRLRLATVYVDTPRGPVHAVAQQLDVGAARELAVGQLDRARAARLADRERRPVEELAVDSRADQAGAEALLADFGSSRDQWLGAGGESEVFALPAEHDSEQQNYPHDPTVLRIYRPTHEAPEQVAHQLQQLYRFWRDAPSTLRLPSIRQLGHRHGRFFTVDDQLPGRPLSGWLRDAHESERRRVLLTLLDAAEAVSRLPLPVSGFARLVGPGAPQTYATLTELADAMLAGPTRRSRDRLTRDVPGVARAWDRLHHELAQRRVAPAVVHGDLAASNVYISGGSAGQPPRVSAVGDFSPHTLQADPLLDLTGAVAFLEIEDYPEAAADSAWLLGAAIERYGTEVAHWIGVYRRYYGFYFSDTYAFDPATYGWCLRQLDTA